jgi:uncharacterized protein YbjT (DUF2867 family)
MILVTGGTGTAGGEIVSQLAATGTPLRAMVRDPTKALTLRLTGVEIVPGDLSKPETLAPALKGIDQVLLLSGPNPKQVVLEGNLVDAAKKAGIRHIVKFSAMTADRNSPSTFPCWHGQIEQHIQDSGLAWTFLRPTFFMQNLLDLADMVKQGTIYQPAGDSKAGFVDAEDIAAVAVEALTEPGHEGHAYDITGPELLTYHDIARTFSDVLGKPVAYQDVPPAVAKQGMIDMGMAEWTADAINQLMDQMRAGMYAKLTTVVADVGKKDPVSLKTFITEHAGKFR